MQLTHVPAELRESVDALFVRPIQRSYRFNRDRFEPDQGDDATTFGMAVYRNSWFQIEQAAATIDGFSTARPQGSLRVEGHGRSVHVYRHGSTAGVDLDSFRLDDAAASATQAMIVANNTNQLTLELGDDFDAPPVDVTQVLHDLVVLHAGNPDDACQGVWMGAPVQTEHASGSPWAWIEPLWLPTDADDSLPDAKVTSTPTGHLELAEPDLDLRPRSRDEEETDSQ